MTMLGAQLDDLEALASQLRTTAATIGDTNTDARSQTTAVVTACRDAAAQSFRAITGALDLLNSSVLRSSEHARTATWTGANQQRFLDASHEFGAALGEVDSATRATFEQFQSNINAMADALESFQATLHTSLLRAHDSTEAMASAVDAQRTTLDMAMNQGLS